ncbi:MAG: hypothetical protein V1894_03590 [Chloroflexota bacterium]
MKKHLVWYLVGLVVLTLIVAACGGGTSTSTVSASAISHPTAGFEDCLKCHATGTSGATAVPANHSSYTNSMCTNCHKPK